MEDMSSPSMCNLSSPRIDDVLLRVSVNRLYYLSNRKFELNSCQFQAQIRADPDDSRASRITKDRGGTPPRFPLCSSQRSIEIRAKPSGWSLRTGDRCSTPPRERKVSIMHSAHSLRAGFDPPTIPFGSEFRPAACSESKQHELPSHFPLNPIERSQFDLEKLKKG